VASVWIRPRPTKSGGVRHVVQFRVGGRDTPVQHAGSFPTKRLARIRAAWIEGELAANRTPNVRLAQQEVSALTLRQASERWQASRVDVAGATTTQHRTALNRALPTLASRRVDAITAADIADLVALLANDGKARESIRKTLTALAMVFDYIDAPLHGRDGRGRPVNAARDRVVVKLPREEPEEPNPPTAEQVEIVYRLVPSKHRLPLLFLDWSGARVSAIDRTLVGDYDEPRRRVRLRAATTKQRRALWIELHPALADELEETLAPREDRDPTALLFPESGADALRTAIAKACKAAGVPLWSPHDLRHRRISLLHLRGVPWARIGEFVGQRNLSVTANTYTHVLLDETELDYMRLLA
jgi:integrase